MTVGFFTDGFLPQINGVSTSVNNSAEGLRKRGHKVYVVAPKDPHFKDKNKYTIRLHSIPVIKRLKLRLATHLPEMALLDISKIKFDIIHGHSGGPVTLLGFEYAKIKKVPYVFTYHTLFNKYTHYFLQGKVIKPKMAEVVSRIFCNQCDYIVAPTQRVKNELISYGVKKPIVVIPSGIDVEKFKTAKNGFLRKKLNIANDKKILLYVGRLAKEKSLDFLIKAFSEVARKDKSSVFVLVGDGGDGEAKILKNLANKLGLEKRVYFAGAVPQDKIAEVYADGYLFLFASESETQGMVIIESLASGLPVVAVKDESLDLIKNEENGVLVARNEHAFAESVLNLLSNSSKREKMSKVARKSAENLSVDKNAEKLENLYRGLI